MTTSATRPSGDPLSVWFEHWFNQHAQRASIEPANRADCLSETAAAMFIDRRMPPAQARELEVHIDDCSCCRELIAALARARFSGWAVVELDPLRQPERTPEESAMLSRRYLEDELGFEVGHR